MLHAGRYFGLLLFIGIVLVILAIPLAHSLTLHIEVNETVLGSVKWDVKENDGLVEFVNYFDNLGSLTCNVQNMIEVCGSAGCQYLWSEKKEVLPSASKSFSLRAFLDPGNYSYRTVTRYCTKTDSFSGEISVDDNSYRKIEFVKKMRAFVEYEKMYVLVKLTNGVKMDNAILCVIPDKLPQNIVLNSACEPVSDFVKFDLYFDAPRHLQNDTITLVITLHSEEENQFQKVEVEPEYIDNFLQKILLYLRLKFGVF